MLTMTGKMDVRYDEPQGHALSDGHWLLYISLVDTAAGGKVWSSAAGRPPRFTR